jgi:hypothetical protein
MGEKGETKGEKSDYVRKSDYGIKVRLVRKSETMG